MERCLQQWISQRRRCRCFPRWKFCWCNFFRFTPAMVGAWSLKKNDQTRWENMLLFALHWISPKNSSGTQSIRLEKLRNIRMLKKVKILSLLLLDISKGELNKNSLYLMSHKKRFVQIKISELHIQQALTKLMDTLGF